MAIVILDSITHFDSSHPTRINWPSIHEQLKASVELKAEITCRIEQQEDAC